MRHLESGDCSFDEELVNNTIFENPCTVCDFNVKSHFDLGDEYRSSIQRHCNVEHFLYKDVQVCQDFADVTSDYKRSCYFDDV